MHAENCQTSKVELPLGNSWNQQVIFCKKLPLRCLVGLKVRNIVDDDDDNKETSKLAEEIYSKIDQTSKMEIFRK